MANSLLLQRMARSTLQWALTALLWCRANPALGSQSGQTVELDLKTFRHITLGELRPTIYRNDGPQLDMRVRSSASLLLKAFVAKRTVRGVSFRWRSAGVLRVKDARSEGTKRGDDFRLRVGLLLAGPAPSIPLFVPGWVKAIRDYMKLPSDHIRYLVVDARHRPGTVWSGPYSGSMDYLALDSQPAAGGWMRASATWSKPLSVVGLWIMADGDNTDSTFETSLDDLFLR